MLASVEGNHKDRGHSLIEVCPHTLHAKNKCVSTLFFWPSFLFHTFCGIFSKPIIRCQEEAYIYCSRIQQIQAALEIKLQKVDL